MKTATVLIYVVYFLYLHFKHRQNKKNDIENCYRKQLEETKMSRMMVDTPAELKIGTFCPKSISKIPVFNLQITL